MLIATTQKTLEDLAVRPRDGLYRRIVERMTAHRVSLAIVLLACGIGQAIVLVQSPLVYQWPDTVQYLANAQHILHGLQFADPWRTPGYPSFLALIFAITGGEHLAAVVYAQAALTVAAALEIYVLAYRLCGRRWEAGLIAALIGVDPFVINWERCILTETLTYWSVVTLFLIFERAVRKERTSTLMGMGLMSAALILVRPQFLFLPVILVAVMALRSARMKTLPHRWKALAMSFAVTCALILGYMAANAATYGYFGLSDLSNLNLFGKVLEYRMYRMPGAGTDPRFARFQADVTSYMATKPANESLVAYDVWKFVYDHPQYDAHQWQIYGAYSMQLIEHHPLYYLTQTYPDVLVCGYATPEVWAPIWHDDITYWPGWFVGLTALFVFLAQLFAFLPVIVIATGFWAWRWTHRTRPVVLFTLALAVGSNVLMSAATDFTQLWRLRSPLDWAMILVLVVVGVEIVKSLAASLTRARQRTGVVSPREVEG